MGNLIWFKYRYFSPGMEEAGGGKKVTRGSQTLALTQIRDLGGELPDGVPVGRRYLVLS